MEDLKILVVDDNFEALNLVRRMLEDAGINKIFTAMDGQQALDIIRATDGDGLVNLVLCDWNMPRMTGVQLLREIRTVDPDIPFLMMTGMAELKCVEEAKSFGVSGYIKKPFSANDLQKKLSAMARIIAYRQ